ncbi:hypothetical protein R1sor_021453 [Riccia sorocarpa]|uniref:Uncharacterized protein n=1 Tax=Riccia sorocarpa TaxID=122646 RepID=A0ABD3GH42_9MARC
MEEAIRYRVEKDCTMVLENVLGGNVDPMSTGSPAHMTTHVSHIPGSSQARRTATGNSAQGNEDLRFTGDRTDAAEIRNQDFPPLGSNLEWRRGPMILGRTSRRGVTPLYQLLSVGMHTKGLEDLEKLCRQFLWGWNEEGSPKASIIAWERIAAEKDDGGLGWTPLKVKAKAMYIRTVLKIVQDAAVEWIHPARNLILRTLTKGKYQRERRQWQLADTLLLIRINKVKGSNTLTRMLQAWRYMLKRITWDRNFQELPGHLTLAQGVHLMTWDDGAQEQEWMGITTMLRKAGITTVTEGKQFLPPTQHGGIE